MPAAAATQSGRGVALVPEGEKPSLPQGLSCLTPPSTSPKHNHVSANYRFPCPADSESHGLLTSSRKAAHPLHTSRIHSPVGPLDQGGVELLHTDCEAWDERTVRDTAPGSPPQQGRTNLTGHHSGNNQLPLPFQATTTYRPLNMQQLKQAGGPGSRGVSSYSD